MSKLWHVSANEKRNSGPEAIVGRVCRSCDTYKQKKKKKKKEFADLQ